MSHPGNGPDHSPAGQQPGQPYPPVGQQQGQPYPPFEQQQGQPAGAWTPPGGASPAGEPQKKSVLKKALPIIGGVVGLGVVASAFGLFGGEPEVGECIHMTGMTDFEEVDCGSDEADGKVVGIDEAEMTYEEFEKPTTEVCMDFATAEIALWYGTEGGPGQVYCAEPV